MIELPDYQNLTRESYEELEKKVRKLEVSEENYRCRFKNASFHSTDWEVEDRIEDIRRHGWVFKDATVHIYDFITHISSHDSWGEAANFLDSYEDKERISKLDLFSEGHMPERIEEEIRWQAALALPVEMEQRCKYGEYRIGQ